MTVIICQWHVTRCQHITFRQTVIICQWHVTRVSMFRHHVSFGRNVKHNEFFVTLEQRNVERKRNFLRSNVIFMKMKHFATFRSNETWNTIFFTWDKRNVKRNNSVSFPFRTFDTSTCNNCVALVWPLACSHLQRSRAAQTHHHSGDRIKTRRTRYRET
jgi:hypothetical protein